MNRVVHTIGSLGATKGGPSRTVPRLCRELQRMGSWQPRLIAADATMPADADGTGLDRSLGTGGAGSSFWRAVGDALASGEPGPRILHDHGVWLRSNATANVRARLAGVPVVISPRGMLEPWALGHHAWKKRLAMALYQRGLLRAAAGFHATSEDEAENLRQLGLVQPIAVIPNGVDTPPLRAPVDLPYRQVLFLSRLNIKKGVIPLLEAWSRLRPAGWQLVLVGPDEGGYLELVLSTIERLALRDLVQVLPEVDDSKKWALYHASDLFVLPSFSENFGVVVAEALAAGVPAITTTGMPWSEVVARRCGWRIEPNVDAIESALREATTIDRVQLRAMGLRGREWMASSYSWNAIGEAMSQFYTWLQGGAVSELAPGFVRLRQKR